MYAASVNGRYIARCDNSFNVEIHHEDGKVCVIEGLQNPYNLCFVNEASILISLDFAMVEYTVRGDLVRNLFLQHCPYSVVCDGSDIVYVSTSEKALVVYDYHSGLLRHKFDISSYFQGSFMELTKSLNSSCVFVHDYLSIKVGIINYVTGEFISYVDTGADWYHKDVLDFGDFYALIKYYTLLQDFIELRDWKENKVVDFCPIKDIISFAPGAKKVLTKSSTGGFKWYKLWYFTERAQLLRALM